MKTSLNIRPVKYLLREKERISVFWITVKTIMKSHDVKNIKDIQN